MGMYDSSLTRVKPVLMLYASDCNCRARGCRGCSHSFISGPVVADPMQEP